MVVFVCVSTPHTQLQLTSVVPFAYIKKLNFPGWYSSTLKYCANKKSHYFRCYKRTKNDVGSAAFSHFRKLVKITIKFDT
jgi:hypothetical protein